MTKLMLVSALGGAGWGAFALSAPARPVEPPKAAPRMELPPPRSDARSAPKPEPAELPPADDLGDGGCGGD